MIPEAEHGNGVWRRLLAPGGAVTFDALVGQWRCLEISAIVAGHAAAADHPRLAVDLRGALGRGLMAGASPASLAGKVCDWEPACANDVLFGPKPLLKVSRHSHEIPKPFVLNTRVRGDDLVLTVLLFGFACDWAGEVRAALAQVPRERLDWERLANGRFLPAERRIDMVQRVRPCRTDPAPTRAVMQFATPVDCKNADPADRPESILSRLASRLFLLARWHDVSIAADWAALSGAWRDAELAVSNSTVQVIERKSTRTARRFNETVRRLDLTLEGDLTALWPLLVMGEQAHVGRGVTMGLGRYDLLPQDS
ncbi:MAG: CRISPR system precrRNA processing endoribonuclease RAMP protein Cas6 [Rhizobiaceae bacterium]|nr:CRISPR system precrRNA processing endoribonuclease RAMP protein Cas6 [Rhizobiaceae bacterium]